MHLLTYHKANLRNTEKLTSTQMVNATSSDNLKSENFPASAHAAQSPPRFNGVPQETHKPELTRQLRRSIKNSPTGNTKTHGKRIMYCQLIFIT
tara:strand:+ start:1386 stop:1667 length:282 start_codon:yes stop_codon:yes gene_type:complete